MANGSFSVLVIRTTDILGDVEEMEIPQPSYAELREIDFSDEIIPYWFDSTCSWDVDDFTNPEIYKSVEVFWR